MSILNTVCYGMAFGIILIWLDPLKIVWSS